MIRNTLPLGLIDNPRLAQWINFEVPGKVRIATGKVELGQGILTALVQIAADELDVEPARIAIISGDTQESPAEGFTAGSMSVENSGGSIRLVAAQVRAMLIDAVVRKLGCANTELTIADGTVLYQSTATHFDYWSLRTEIDLTVAATGAVAVKSPAQRTLIGTNLPRRDLPAKVFGLGGPFIHDVRSTDLLHARVVRQPWPDAAVANAGDLTTGLLGTQIFRTGAFLALTGDCEHTVATAAANLAVRVLWSGGRPLPPAMVEPRWIAAQPSRITTTAHGQAPQAAVATTILKATYSKPFIAHASIGPSCALAKYEAGRLQVWTHSQGVRPLRVALADALALDAATVHVQHLPGAGCYGHNGADDAACDASIIAINHPGRLVRVQWSREDELAAAPFGSAMVVELEADLTADGRPVSWKTSLWSGPHVQRPGANGGVNLLGATCLPAPPPRVDAQELPEAAGGSATRNARLLYDVPYQVITNHMVTDMALRTSSMRGLGAFANIFASESFMDELAARAATDPLQYRLSLLSDPRARTVLQTAARMANWSTTEKRREGHGRGIAFSRYKNRAGYLALVVEVRVEDEVRLDNVWCAVDAGLAINPDGVRNQVEGGIIQAASWTLIEQALFEDGRVASNTWQRYPILRFSQVPEIEISLIDQPDQPTLGVGEVAQGPTAAAIANAVNDALGVRIRELPITRDRIIATLSS